MLAQAHVAALAGRHLSAGLVVAGSVLMAAATVAGAWLALRRPGRHGAWLGAASGALLVIALLHLLPDAWSAARAADDVPIPGAVRPAVWSLPPAPRPVSMRRTVCDLGRG